MVAIQSGDLRDNWLFQQPGSWDQKLLELEEIGRTQKQLEEPNLTSPGQVRHGPSPEPKARSKLPPWGMCSLQLPHEAVLE